MQLNYKSFGQGDPLVILHGLFGSLDNWQTIAKQLAEFYTVFIIDLRNHGRSPHVNEHSYELMAEDVFNFMSDNWIYGANVIGHSMGGKVAIRLALDYPEQVNKLIIADMGIKQSERGHETIFEAMFDLDLLNLDSRTIIDNQLKTRITELGVRQFLLKNLSRRKEGGYKWKMNLPALHEHYDEILKEIESDSTFDNLTLFLRGGNSNYVLNEDFEDIQTLFPNSKLETIEGAGHWLHAEKPKEFVQYVRAFLED
ncbi:MAG: alpha/beta fold hydrolase [Saprospiraceae bacterium]